MVCGLAAARVLPAEVVGVDSALISAVALLGTPAVAVPGLLGPAGLPLGVQVVAAPDADATAIAAAHWLAERL